MQKVFRRTALAKRQAARRSEVAGQKLKAGKKSQEKDVQKRYRIEARQLIRAARVSQREDFFQGALAPRRDVGETADTYGTVTPNLIMGVKHPGFHPGNWHIVSGDRVVIVDDGHRDQGKIGKVTEVNKKLYTCQIEGLNAADVAVPEFMTKASPDEPVRQIIPLNISLSSVRLVYPLTDPHTGSMRDTIISQLSSLGNRRFIKGVIPRIFIPRPEKEAIEPTEHDGDTLRIEVEERTFVPTILSPPMPPSIIDELRNKYSKFRDRHDEDFVAKKEAEDREKIEEKARMRMKMMTPLQELHRKERAERKARGWPGITDETLAKVGETMEKNLSFSDKQRLTSSFLLEEMDGTSSEEIPSETTIPPPDMTIPPETLIETSSPSNTISP
ncbi:hypothetical protein MMC25_006950 [Agyrium rufum]|nr:hypothetical protein [Agyrium rufum]